MVPLSTVPGCFEESCGTHIPSKPSIAVRSESTIACSVLVPPPSPVEEDEDDEEDGEEYTVLGAAVTVTGAGVVTTGVPAELGRSSTTASAPITARTTIAAAATIHSADDERAGAAGAGTGATGIGATGIEARGTGGWGSGRTTGRTIWRGAGGGPHGAAGRGAPAPTSTCGAGRRAPQARHIGRSAIRSAPQLHRSFT
ncbi:hypothetical protein GCM10023199_34240 [Actinomycetospora chibensis]